MAYNAPRSFVTCKFGHDTPLEWGGLDANGECVDCHMTPRVRPYFGGAAGAILPR